MATGRLERLAPLAGVVFTVVFAVGFLISGDTPDSDATGEEVIKHYDDDAKVLAGFLLIMFASLMFMFFAGVLRRHLAASGPDWLAPVVFGGAVIYVVGLSIFALSQFALVEAADNKQAAVAETLNVIDNTNFATVGFGLVIILFASAWHILASRSLPVWLGWTALVLGVLGFAGPLGFVSFLLFPFWVVAVAIVLFRRTGTVGPPATA
jgi:hypothetical protein